MGNDDLLYNQVEKKKKRDESMGKGRITLTHFVQMTQSGTLMSHLP